MISPSVHGNGSFQASMLMGHGFVLFHDFGHQQTYQHIPSMESMNYEEAFANVRVKYGHTVVTLSCSTICNITHSK